MNARTLLTNYDHLDRFCAFGIVDEENFEKLTLNETKFFIEKLLPGEIIIGVRFTKNKKGF